MSYEITDISTGNYTYIDNNYSINVDKNDSALLDIQLKSDLVLLDGVKEIFSSSKVGSTFG